MVRREPRLLGFVKKEYNLLSVRHTYKSMSELNGQYETPLGRDAGKCCPILKNKNTHKVVH